MCLNEEKIPGGLSKGMSIQDIADHHELPIKDIITQLKKGIKVEKEHTTDDNIALEIAMDHVVEDPVYYDKLKKIEANEVFDKKWWKRVITEEILPKDKRESILVEFVEFCAEVLDIQDVKSKIDFTEDKNDTKTFAHFNPSDNEIVVYVKNRNLADILRSLSHELVHMKQNKEGKLNRTSGKTGSPEENQANTIAGILMREFGRLHPEIFE